MPELAAHLERVAKLEQLSTLDVPDHNGHMVQWIRKKEVRPIVAAALAACAREARRDEAVDWRDAAVSLTRAAHEKWMESRMAELRAERAVGEKGK